MSKNPIKVLIADDEVIIRRGLISTVEWSKYNMCVVADAPNGLKAWDAFLLHRPEVIITDIVMPEMNGIELARKVKEHSPETKILLLSCHRDFEYAQQGLKLGASGYLLKTSFDDYELEQFLQAFERDIQLSTSNFSNKSGNDELQLSFMEWIYGINDHFLNRLDVLFAQGLLWLKEEPNYVYLIGSESKDEIQTIKHVLQENMESSQKLLWSIGETYLILLCSDACRKESDGQLCEMKGTYLGLHWNKSGPIFGLEQSTLAIHKFYQQTIFEKQYQIHIGHWPQQITLAVQLIIHNADKSLSVSDVAHEIGLSRSHFSTLFKKIVGESFISFTYRIKLKIACELLSSTKLNIQQISDKVGMPDVKYFSKWFKRCMQQTPSQFRIQIKTPASSNNSPLQL